MSKDFLTFQMYILIVIVCVRRNSGTYIILKDVFKSLVKLSSAFCFFFLNINYCHLTLYLLPQMTCIYFCENKII